ncbi:MAG: 3-methyl-2-oxobutanoate hydroxymethyltransferase [Chloroflexi bacterium RBG_13_68_17]|nr:MAG: 3-methyl-2-oxobutanoate hydroxymethyltransferase [Chloroflexi bacterium RBG_13_68_17]
MSATPAPQDRKRVTVQALREKKARREPITCLTAYDYPTAVALDRTGIDILLVGDSLGMVVLGYENTLPVTMDEMLHHCKAVARGARFALLVGDMPFLSYQISPPEAVRNAGRFIQESGMHAVKLEGGQERLAAVQAILDVGIPVMGHLGLTPQSVHQLGGFRMQATTAAAARRLLDDALALERAGCFSLVLESIPTRLAGLVSSRLQIPTIGIGAGPGCDGQVLVTHDLLGLFDRFTPRFAKKYVDLHAAMAGAFGAFKSEVESGAFPAPEHCADMPDDEWQSLLSDLRS